jgi:hypothetical protein
MILEFASFILNIQVKGLWSAIIFTGSRAPWALASDFQFHDNFTDGRTPWTGDQLVARPLPKYKTTQIHNKHIHIPNIHALYGIRTHDPGFRAREDSICLRSLGYRDRRSVIIVNIVPRIYGLNCLHAHTMAVS